MIRSSGGLLVLGLAALAACSDDARPVNVPLVPAGEYEADCQRLCTLAAGDIACQAKHVEFCVASCRARTNGLPAACATCLFDAGSTIHGFTSFEDKYCDTGGPGNIAACEQACDDGGSAPSTGIAVQCELACTFYMQSPTPLACSAEGSADCRAGCDAALAAHGRVCAQCLIDDTIPVRSCINDDCDCEPSFDGEPGFGCENLCDAAPPA